MANPEDPTSGARARDRRGSGGGEQQPSASPGTAPGTEPKRSGPQLRYARIEPSLATLRVLGTPASVPMPPHERQVRQESVPPPLTVPVYGPVNRAVPLDVPTIDVVEKNPDGTVNFVRRTMFNYPSGPFPAEPSRVPGYVNPRTAVCYRLTPRAAYRCLRSGGYF